MLSRQRVLRSGCTDGTQADFKEQVAPVWILDVADSLRGFRATGGEGWPIHTANRHVQEPDDRCRLRSRGVALVRVFRQRPAFRPRAGRRPPLAWHNVVLDLLILVPMTNMGLGDYAGEIALRYLVIPIMAVAIGAAAGPSGDAG